MTNKTDYLLMIKRILAILIGVSIPVSTALTNITIFLVILILLFEAHTQRLYRPYFTILCEHPVTMPALALFALMIVGMLYTPASFSESLSMLSKYRELLYILVFILLFRDSVTREYGLYAFIAIMGITLFLSYLTALTGWQVGKGTADNPFIFKNHITQGILMALAAYYVAIQCLQETSWKAARGIAVSLALGNILFMTQGRTGYLIIACLMLLFACQIFKLRGLLIGSVILIMAGGLIYTTSSLVHTRIDKITENVQDYKRGNADTSIGLRFEFYKNSVSLIADHPLLGSGTGSFAQKYEQLVSKNKNTRLTTNPHNEYLMIAVQWGLLGMGLFVYLLYRLWQMANRLNMQQTWMAQGLIITMAVGCLVNSLLLDFTEGHLFAYLVGVLYAELLPVSEI